MLNDKPRRLPLAVQASACAVAEVPSLTGLGDRPAAATWDYLRALRPQHWLKNFLVFVPLLAAHRFLEPLLWERVFVEFAAFCCLASSGYLVNDLCDLRADRQHPQKRHRVLASGRLPPAYALAAAPALAVLGCTLAGSLSVVCLGTVLLYFALTLGYSFVFKKVVLLDVLLLAVLYTLRILAGASAMSSWPSVWLVAFPMLLFTSLAFIKRYTELMLMRAAAGENATARGYVAADAGLLVSFGTASAYAAVVVLALYFANASVQAPASRHQLIWLLCPLLLYWVGYLWLIAHRGKMHHDPLVFAVRDRTSRILMLLMLGTSLAAL
jgi:4-hydroxybenzoate polyprenyltransferase